MSSSYVLPQGSHLQRQNPSTSAWENVPQVVEIGFPTAAQEYDDITNMDSDPGYHERVATLKAPADVPATVIFSPSIAMHNTILDDINTNPVPLRNWKILWPNGTDGFSFSAFPTLGTGTATPTSAVRLPLVLAISGGITRLS